MTTSIGGRGSEPRPPDCREGGLKTYYRRVDLGIAIGLSLIGLAAVVGAALTIPPPANAIQADPVGPRGFAYLFGSLTTVLGLLLVRSLVKKQATTGGVGIKALEDPEVTGDDPRFPASWQRAFKIMALTFVYGLLLVPLGYIVSSTLYVAACMWVMGARRRGQVVAFPLVYAVITYLFFHVVLDVRLPKSLIENGLTAIGVG